MSTWAAEPGWAMGHVPPLFLKVKKVPFFLGLSAPFKKRKVLRLPNYILRLDYFIFTTIAILLS